MFVLLVAQSSQRRPHFALTAVHPLIMKSTSEPTSSPAAEKSNNTQPSKLIGFSDRYKDPEILAAAKTNRKASIGWMWILVLAPLIGFPIAGFLMDDLPLGKGWSSAWGGSPL